MRITYFVHSTTTDNEAGLATGWLQSVLSDKGIEQAKLLSKTLANQSFDAVFTSDLQRAMESTKLFFGERFPVFIDWRLRECSYGNLDGQPAKEFKKDREQLFIADEYPGGESYQDVEARMRSFLNDITSSLPYDHVAIVAHQAPQLALDVILRDKSWAEAIEQDWRKTQSWQPGWEYRT